jgi:hypothetical protein
MENDSKISRDDGIFNQYINNAKNKKQKLIKSNSMNKFTINYSFPLTAQAKGTNLPVQFRRTTNDYPFKDFINSKFKKNNHDVNVKKVLKKCLSNKNLEITKNDICNDSYLSVRERKYMPVLWDNVDKSIFAQLAVPRTQVRLRRIGD